MAWTEEVLRDLKAVRFDDEHLVGEDALRRMESDGLVQKVEYYVLTWDGEEALDS